MSLHSKTEISNHAQIAALIFINFVLAIAATIFAVKAVRNPICWMHTVFVAMSSHHLKSLICRIAVPSADMFLLPGAG